MVQLLSPQNKALHRQHLVFPNITQRSDRGLGLYRRLLPVQSICRKRNRLLREPNLCAHPSQSKKLEDMLQHPDIAPPANIIRRRYTRLILFRQ